jgi:hypothetical protein
MSEIIVSPEWIVGIAGVLLSLAFSYIPYLRVKYASLSGEVKRLIMLGLLVLVSVVVFMLQCYGILASNLACDKQGAITLVRYLIIAIVSNQSAYMITPQTSDVKPK